MTKEKVYLGSDNFAPVHPAIIEAISEANKGYALPYGADDWTRKAEQLFCEVFKSACRVYFTPNGTGANVLALKLSCRRHESVICTDIAHVHYQESGAAESVVGCKLLTVPHKNGKITPEEVIKRVKAERAFGKHSTSPRVLSIAQSSDVGTVYTLQELKTLAALCKEEKLLFHIDGSRLYNAAAHLRLSLSEITQAVPADIISLGGTKNGLLCGEAVVIFNHALLEGAEHLHKQTLLLMSKMRYTSAQFISFLENELWHTLAAHANQRASEIAALIESIPQLSLVYPVQTNQIFFSAPSSWIPLIQEKIACYLYLWKENSEIRFITSWDTTEEDVERVRSFFLELSRNHP